jgi:hypothetical protein
VESGIPIVDTRNALRDFAAPNVLGLSGRGRVAIVEVG